MRTAHGRTFGTRVRVAGFVVDLEITWTPAAGSGSAVLEEHEQTDANADLEVRVVPRRSFETEVAKAGSECGTFDTVYGRFMAARWHMTDPIRVVMTPTHSPLRLVRPFVDSEGHAIHQDAARMVTERIIPTYVQLCRANELSFVHGAAMADSAGDGLLISGRGGVGKTSLALELGLKDGWRFVSDDLVALDTEGTIHLNGSHPKIYGYNVQGDPALEGRLMKDRSALDRFQWRVRQPWPSKVRRAMAPSDLYTSSVASAPLKWMFLVERGDVNRIRMAEISPSEAADASAEILLEELAKARPDVENYLRTRSGHGDMNLTWSPTTWGATIAAGLSETTIHRVTVPSAMLASPYRHEMRRLVQDLTSHSLRS